MDSLDRILTSGGVDLVLLGPLNRVAARLFEREGLPRRALLAVRRTGEESVTANSFVAARSREEGRLALMVGDTALAIEAYSLSLDFRYAPEPELQAEADQVRAQLTALVER